MESILGQYTKYSFCVDVVDDGSTDASAAVCEDYVQRFPAVFTLVRQQNMGLSTARNTGLRAAKGDWIAFADSDDFLLGGGYRFLFESINGMNCDKVVFGCWGVAYGSEPPAVTLEAAKSVEHIKGLEYLRHRCDIPAWCSLYRREFLVRHGLRFRSDITACEDLFFNLACNLCNPTLCIVPLRIYVYVLRRPGSIINTRSAAFARQAVDSYMELLTWIAEQAEQVESQHSEVSANLMSIAHERLVPWLSRVLTGDFTSKEFRQMRERLRMAGVVPFKAGSKTEWLLTIILATPRLLGLYRWLFRRIFIPHILPRLGRS